MLPYAGRPIFERLLRDLTAREYLYFRIFGQQCTSPVAIMTSDAKGNHQRVCDMLAREGYYGRPEESFRLFNQPLVPVLEAATGRWVLPEPLRPSMKPGGHGAIWKLMHDHGIFEWLQGQGAAPLRSVTCIVPIHLASLCEPDFCAAMNLLGEAAVSPWQQTTRCLARLAQMECDTVLAVRAGRTAALVRQISNPMAATDCTLLALAGTGHKGQRAFGFASCDRVVGAAEGMNVLRREWQPAAGANENSSAASNGAESLRGNAAAAVGSAGEYRYGVTNVEYTEFQRLGISDQAVCEGSDQSCFPANTNILYVGAYPCARVLTCCCAVARHAAQSLCTEVPFL